MSLPLNAVLLGDCLEILPTLPASSIDCVVCDPPYGLGNREPTLDEILAYLQGSGLNTGGDFMGHAWQIPSVAVWRECFRVLKPGGHLLSFAGTRTIGLIHVGIQAAGFQCRDTVATQFGTTVLQWVYGCLSADTEVLTPGGWERYHTAREKSILIYDLQTDIYQWEKPQRWYVYPVESDTAYRIQSGYTDQIVSRGHRCLVERDGELLLIPAEELAGVEFVPALPDNFCGLPEELSQVLQPSMQWGLPGQELGDACSQGTSGVDGYESGQPQSKDDWREESSVAGRLDLLQAKGQVRGSVHQVHSLSTDVHNDVAEGRLRYGAPYSGGIGAGQTSDAGGVCSSHKSQCHGQSVGKLDAVQVERRSQALRTRPTYRTDLATITGVIYSGVFFCPTVSTGVFIARRNGKVFLTGNSGFPKSLNIAKALKKAGAAPEVAARWEGWGTALKPAWEPVLVFRKPLEESTVVAQVLATGTGGLNIDALRITTQENLGGAGEFQQPSGRWPANVLLVHQEGCKQVGTQRVKAPVINRFDDGMKPFGDGAGHAFTSTQTGDADGMEEVPVYECEDGCPVKLLDQQSGVLKSGAFDQASKKAENTIYGKHPAYSEPKQYEVSVGGASRFFGQIQPDAPFLYTAKVSKSERNRGLTSEGFREGLVVLKDDLPPEALELLADQWPETLPSPTGPLDKTLVPEAFTQFFEDLKPGVNPHPTIKPLALMTWLVKLVAPKGSVILDPYFGSGTTGLAALEADCTFIGIERDPVFHGVAKSRIEGMADTLEASADDRRAREVFALMQELAGDE
jgi:DNA modification methylase